MSEQFWMVWSPQGHAPTQRHQSEYAAANEAQRLALKCPGREFYVLRATHKIVKRDVECVNLETGQPDGDPLIPF